MNDEFDDVAHGGMAMVLPHRSKLGKALKALDGEVAERRPGQPQNPMGERGDAAQYLGGLTALVEMMHTPLRGGPLHKDVQKGYLNAYERNIPAIFAQLGDRSKYDEAFVRQGVQLVPNASQQMLLAALGFGIAGKAMMAASLIAEGVENLSDEEQDAVQKLSEDAYELADVLTKYTADKRAQWAAEGGS